MDLVCSLVPACMNVKTYPWMYPCLSTESVYDHTQASNAASTSFPLPGPPVSDKAWTNSRPLVIPVCTGGHAEAYSARLHPALHSTHRAVDEVAETSHPEIPIADIHDGDSPITACPHPSETDFICQREFSRFTPCISLESTLRGSGASNEDQRDTNLNAAKVDVIRNGRQEGMVMNTLQSLDHGHRYTGINTACSVSVPSTLPRISWLPTVVPYQEQSTSRDQLREFHGTGKGPTAASSWASRPQDGIRGAPQARYWCSICGLGYAQERGVTRHRRDVHEVSLCTYCGHFKWHRRHQLEKHLREQHPDIDLSAALHEATRSRRKATIIKDRRQRRVSPPIEHARWGRIEYRPRPPMPPSLPAVARITVTTVPLPPMSIVDCDTQPESAEPAIKKFEREDTSALELLNATYAHTAFQSTKERAQLVTDLSMSARPVEARFQNRKQSASPRPAQPTLYTYPWNPWQPRPWTGPAPVGDLKTDHNGQRFTTGISSR